MPPSSSQRENPEVRSLGRGFASADPERQREAAGAVRPIGTQPNAAASERAARTARVGWMRVLPERDASTYEGGSSRRWR